MSNLMTEPPYLEALRQQEQADMDGTMVRVSRQAVDEAIADIERLRAALETIARQKKTDELETACDVEYADFEGGYDECIDAARAALGEPTPQPMEKGS